MQYQSKRDGGFIFALLTWAAVSDRTEASVVQNVVVAHMRGTRGLQVPVKTDPRFGVHVT